MRWILLLDRYRAVDDVTHRYPRLSSHTIWVNLTTKFAVVVHCRAAIYIETVSSTLWERCRQLGRDMLCCDLWIYPTTTEFVRFVELPYLREVHSSSNARDDALSWHLLNNNSILVNSIRNPVCCREFDNDAAADTDEEARCRRRSNRFVVGPLSLSPFLSDSVVFNSLWFHQNEPCCAR